MNSSPNLQSSTPRPWAILALVVLIGLNLRPFLAATGPLLPDIVHDLGMSHEAISMLTLLPMLLMGLGAFVSPRIQAAIGTRRGLVAALAILALGLALRLEASSSMTLILTAALCGVGVAFIQAAFPAIIKENFPNNIAVVTGLYSAVLMGGGALGARIMPVMTGIGFGWRAALAWLSVPALIALAVAWLALRETRAPRPDKTIVGHLLRRRRTWALMAAFGLVNGGYSSIITWLAPYYQSLGWRSADSASLVAVMAICQAIAALGLPALARNNPDRRPWLLLTLAMQATGFAGLAFAPEWSPAIWAGIGGAVRELALVHAALGGALESLGLPRETRPFRAHLTLGRVRRETTPAQLERLGAAIRSLAPLAPVAWTVERAVLFRSELRPSGPVYTEMLAMWLR